jgi:hypothetical protein
MADPSADGGLFVSTLDAFKEIAAGAVIGWVQQPRRSVQYITSQYSSMRAVYERSDQSGASVEA